MADRAIAIGTLGRRGGRAIETSHAHERIGMLPPAAWHGWLRRGNTGNAATRDIVRCVRDLRSPLDRASALLQVAALGQTPGGSGDVTHDPRGAPPPTANMPADRSPTAALPSAA